MESVNKIRFLHIPKSAGTSFSNCLRRLYKANRFKHNIFVFEGDFEQDMARYQTLTSEERSKLVLVSGHVPLVTGIQDIDALPTITFLRDPVERVKSLCQHISEGKVWNLDPNQNLDAYLNDPYNIWIDNLQTRTLLGQANYALPETSEASIVALAMDVLENRLACFGITEYFDDSLLLFMHRLGWRAYPIYTKLNQKSTAKLLHFTDSQLAKIRDRNKIDIQVYEAAVGLFKDRLAARADVIEASRQQFRLRQQLFGPILRVYQLYHKYQSRLNRA